MSVFIIASVVLGIIALIAIARIILGPTLADRVVALDATNTMAVAILILLSAEFRQAMFVDIAIVYAMLSFIGTIYFAKYLEANQND
ncbi:MAG: cation:proton antiporter [Candidatus Diapherotrites archaeon]|nr:cation:proton antiporter [Candidatus Diapherotrites archaeon]